MQLTTEQPQATVAGQAILITGAARRVGATIAATLHGAGANVIIHCRNSRQPAQQLVDQLNLERADSAALVCGDLDQVEQLDALVEQAQQHWQRLDGLINNASSFYPTPMGSVTRDEWEDLMSSNLRAPFFLAQAAMPYLQQQRGNIVNIVDIHADKPLSKHPVYCMAKAGLVMMTKSLACELGPEVRVNAIAPGAILWPEANAALSSEQQQKIIDKTFLKRQGSPEDIANAALFLIRDACYMTGQVLAIDGGRSLNT